MFVSINPMLLIYPSTLPVPFGNNVFSESVFILYIDSLVLFFRFHIYNNIISDITYHL